MHISSSWSCIESLRKYFPPFSGGTFISSVVIPFKGVSEKNSNNEAEVDSLGILLAKKMPKYYIYENSKLRKASLANTKYDKIKNNIS